MRSDAGTKDRRGVTTQRVSAYMTRATDLAKLNERLLGIRLGSFAYKQEKLELGALQGNRFIVTLRRVVADGPAVRCQPPPGSGSCAGLTAAHACGGQVDAAVAAVKESGFVNYFGLQRFGTGSVPTHAIGRAFLRKEWRDAVSLIMHPRHGERRPEVAEAREHYARTGDARQALKISRNGFGQIERNVLEKLARNPGDYAAALMTLPRNMRSMCAAPAPCCAPARAR